MGKTGMREIYDNFTYVFKDDKRVGEIKGSKYIPEPGSKDLKLKCDSWEMVDELVGMGYTVRKISQTTYMPGVPSTPDIPGWLTGS